MNLGYILLQIATTSADSIVTTSGAQPTGEGMSLFDLVMKGGYLMIPLFILSIISVYVFIERYLYIKQTAVLDPQFLNIIKDRLRSGNVKGAIEYCENSKYPIAKMLQKGLYRLGSPIRDIESAIENMGNVELSKMEKNLNILGAIAAIAPMVGFLGTVMGMIKAFYNISLADNISIGIIASGIYEKMITSASGLIIGVIAHIFYTYLNSMIDRSVHKMEVTAIDFMDILYKPAA